MFNLELHDATGSQVSECRVVHLIALAVKKPAKAGESAADFLRGSIKLPRKLARRSRDGERKEEASTRCPYRGFSELGSGKRCRCTSQHSFLREAVQGLF